MRNSICLVVKRENLRVLEILLDAFLISLIGAAVILSYDSTKVVALLLQFFVASFALAVILAIRFKVFFKLSFVFYLLSVLLLVYVHFQGHTAGGAARWISVGVFNLQPSELLKVLVPLAILKYYKNRELHLRMHQLVWPLIVITIPSVLILMQPDLGTALVVIFTGISVIYLLGLKRYSIYASLILVVLLLPTLWNLLHHYQRMRVMVFLFPNSYATLSYQVGQSIRAISEGGFLGLGNNPIFVPAGTTDFVFPLFANMFGFVGVLALLTLFYRLISGILLLAKNASNPLKSALAGAYAFLLMISLFINIFMVTGFFPVVGLPLPFMSYGGTALVVNVVVIGLIVSLLPQNTLQQKYPLSTKLHQRQVSRLKKISMIQKIGFAIIFIRLLFIYFM